MIWQTVPGRAQDERDDDDGKIVAAIVHELAHDFAEIMGLFDGTPAAHWSSWHLFYSLKVRIDLPLMKEVARSAGGREAVRDYPSVSCAVLFGSLISSVFAWEQPTGLFPLRLSP